MPRRFTTYREVKREESESVEPSPRVKRESNYNEDDDDVHMKDYRSDPDEDYVDMKKSRSESDDDDDDDDDEYVERKKYKCNDCDYVSFYKTHLDNHQRTHTRERPFPCRWCGKHFTDLSSRRRHEKSEITCKAKPKGVVPSRDNATSEPRSEISQDQEMVTSPMVPFRPNRYRSMPPRVLYGIPRIQMNLATQWQSTEHVSFMDPAGPVYIAPNGDCRDPMFP